MQISVVGSGYVGLVAGVCFADAGHNVICVDNDPHKIAQLKEGKVPIYEPGLEELMKHSKSRLTFTMDMPMATRETDVIFIAVGTPETSDGSADMGPTMSVLNEICKHANRKKYVVLKSTVPIGTAKKLSEYVKTASKQEIEIINNPEFLKEGAAIDDFLRPDRVVIGCKTQEAKKVMWEIYEPFLRNGNPIFFMDNASAEMTKYAANAFLSVKISFINELALMADKVGADINEVRKGFTSDKRINPSFFHPGVGFGGSCFPKDVRELTHTAQHLGIPMQVVKAADEVNDRQKVYLPHLVKKKFGENLKGKTFTLWGLSFKPRTDDVREAPALYIVQELLKAGAQVKAYDPVAQDTAKKTFPKELTICTTAMEALKDSDALLLVTEWNEFRSPDFAQVKSLLKTPTIFDGRNIYDPIRMKTEGFDYYCIGRQALVNNK